MNDIEQKQPYFNARFGQYQIDYNLSDGSYGAVWGNTKEECLERYKEIMQKTH